MPGLQETLLKDFEAALKAVVEKLTDELKAVRGGRPSVELVENLKVNYYEQLIPIKQLASISVLPPRGLQITVWDRNAVAPVMKAIDAAKIGLSTTNDGNNIIATLSPLGNERREELTKLVKKTAEGHRIQIRARRDEVIKKIKDAENKKEMSEDEAFKSKEKVQKIVGEMNKKVEELVGSKLKELSE